MKYLYTVPKDTSSAYYLISSAALYPIKMCIRDSGYTGNHRRQKQDHPKGSDKDEIQLPQSAACPTVWSQAFPADLRVSGSLLSAYDFSVFPAPAPVSYTHLDVYKRQPIYRAELFAFLSLYKEP